MSLRVSRAVSRPMGLEQREEADDELGGGVARGEGFGDNTS